MQFFFVFIVGACLASFIMALCQPHQKNIWRRSQCDGCGLPLKGSQLIPIYSSLIKPIKCLNCNYQPSPFYGVVELGLGLIFIFNVWRWPQLKSQLIIQLYSLLALHIGLWDWQSKQIPFIDLILFLVLTLLWITFQGSLTITPLFLLGALVGLVVVGSLLKRPWILAKGDWILLFLASCWISIWQLPTFLGLAGGIGILTALCYQRMHQTKFFPFAPAILMALWLTLLI